ncbi:Hypothetical protein A7982_01928 [Minicystis rosea]|nr:Hypothetical protein A7982_01928 [Minicystis rosea]
MPSTSVEIVRAERKRNVPAPPPRAPAAPAPAPAAAAPPAAEAPPPAVEIELPNGRVVRVSPGFAPEELERLLAIAAGEGKR